MKPATSRRTFLRTAGALGAGFALGVGPLGTAAPLRAAEAVKSSSPSARKLGWTLGCQLYTFRSMSFYEALEKIAALGFECLEPCFFLPLRKETPGLLLNESLPPEARRELRETLAKRGIRMANFYADLKDDEAACRKTFEFAKEMGVESIVAEPPPEAFEMIDRLCEKHRVNLAVHNHPKSPDSRFWRPEAVLEAAKGRSKRIGGCCDTGHWVRSGLDPVECLKKMEGRLISLHLKDVAEWGNPAARDVPLGTGKGKYESVLRELHRQRFKGVLTVEYEHESPKLVEEVAECVAFVERTAKALS